MKPLILTLIPILLTSCTTYRKDDHSYTYFYQHNSNNNKPSENTEEVPYYKRVSDRISARTERNDLDTSVDLTKFDSDIQFIQNDRTSPSRNTSIYAGNGVTFNPQVKRYIRYGETRW